MAYLTVGALGLAACAAGSGRAGPTWSDRSACTFYQTHDAPIVDASTLGSEFRYLTISGYIEYPSHMRAAAQSGMVALNFDVDTSGRVDPCSVEIVESTGPAFERTVLEWLAKARFRVPLRDGRPARVRVLCACSRFFVHGGFPPPEPTACTPPSRSKEPKPD